MNVRTLIARTALGLLLSLISAVPQAQAACGRVGEPAVSVRVVDPGPRVVSTESLTQINVRAGSHGLTRPGFQVLGMTSISIDSGINVVYQGQPAGGQTCVSVSRVDIRFGLKDHIVHVPREYPRGSCQFNVVMRHEMAHVNVNRKTVSKYATILKNEVRSILRRTGAVAAQSMVLGQNAQTAIIQKVIDDMKVRFNDELSVLHGAIDEPNGKYSAAGQCRGW